MALLLQKFEMIIPTFSYLTVLAIISCCCYGSSLQSNSPDQLVLQQSSASQDQANMLRLLFQYPYDKEKIDNVCLVKKCAGKIAKCALNGDCRVCANCMRKCGTQDMLCSARCFFQYSTPVFNDLVLCGVANKCLPPLTWSDKTCPNLEGRKSDRIPDFDVKSFAKAKTMYVARGSHPVYDCFPCQKLQFKPNKDDVETTWSVYLEPVIRNATYVLKQESKNSIVTKYTLFGMPVEEHYYILDATPDNSFVLYFYCGYGYGGEYQGSVVYSAEKNPEIPKEVQQRFGKILRDLGLRKYVPKFQDYCTPDYSRACANIDQQ